MSEAIKNKLSKFKEEGKLEVVLENKNTAVAFYDKTTGTFLWRIINIEYAEEIYRIWSNQ